MFGFPEGFVYKTQKTLEKTNNTKDNQKTPQQTFGKTNTKKQSV